MKNVFITIMLITFFTNNLQAQIVVDEALKNLINQSIGNFSSIKEVENAEKTANEKLTLIELNKYSDINLSGSYNFVMPKIAFPINGKEIQFAPVHNIATSIGSNYTIYDFGRQKTAVEKEKINIQQAKHTSQLAKTELASQVSTIYYNISFLQKAIILQDSIISYYQENKKTTERKLKNGEALQLDIINLQSSIDQEENKKIDLMNNLEKQQNLLEYLTGSIMKADDKFDFDYEKMGDVMEDSAALANNPLLLLCDDKVSMAKKELNMINKNNSPILSIHGAAGIKNGYVPEVNDVRFNYMGGVAISIPLYNFGKTKQQLKLQESIVKQNELHKNSLSADNKKDIAQVLIDVKYFKEKIKNNESQINAAKMAQNITTSRYQNGIATYLDIALAANNLLKASLNTLQSQYQLCLSKIQLAKLLGYDYWSK